MTRTDGRPAVLVTGGARRIGAAISRCFAAAGWHVIVHYGHSAAQAEEIADELDGSAIHCDLVDAEAAEAMVAHLGAKFPDWRVIVNSASVFERDDAVRMDSDIYRKAMRVNAEAPARMAQAFLRLDPDGPPRRVIQVTDQKLANPNPDFFSYTMSKHALAATIPMLAMDAARSQDKVYGVAPGAILASHDQLETEADVSHRLNLLKRRTGADEIAEACRWLAEGWLESGQTLFVDSGQHLLSQPRDVIFLARSGGS
ncbi:SDR family oxidoreductase [Altererythrobacter aerius]|uniref:SDR family oxidoreductase n=1 Tax=Tsuneonella aeria TaxID=1837929 RepID=A0A6I4TDE8_9SPHN|nr:SDR family oxidoreductase [Tsuneonella aeria]MXO74180.1 SDR family oxidoreductase [Tsuneonella aeria]